MKLFKKLEKSKLFWCVFGASFLFFLLRLPSLIEPYWYGDEGIYEVLGLAISRGRILYSQIFDNKPPLLYLVYALFHGDQFQVKLASLIIGLLAMIAFFFLAQKLFNNLKISLTGSLLFTLLFATPFVEGNIANAENFMLLPILAAGLLVYSAPSLKNSKPISYVILNTRHLILLAAGLLLGLAFLFKIVAVFDFAAFFIFFIIMQLNELGIKNKELWSQKDRLLSLIPNSLFLLLGFLLPFLITVLYFFAKHALGDFFQAAFFSNVGYVGYGNTFIIPQGFLILKLLLLALFILFIFLQRNKLSKSTVFIFLWIAFALFSAFFSGRPYTHYLLVVLSSFCLLVCLLLKAISEKKSYKLQLGASLILLIVIALAATNFGFYGVQKTFSYYKNYLLFLSGKRNITAYQSFFDQKVPRDYEVADFIKSHTGPTDNVFIWGDSAQIYALSDKIPPGRYTVAYHITQYKGAIAETQKALKLSNPKYIVTLSESPPLPFYLPAYTDAFSLKGATIYERSF